jgi:hypothetical protein
MRLRTEPPSKMELATLGSRVNSAIVYTSNLGRWYLAQRSAARTVHWFFSRVNRPSFWSYMALSRRRASVHTSSRYPRAGNDSALATSQAFSTSPSLSAAATSFFSADWRTCARKAANERAALSARACLGSELGFATNRSHR